MRAARLLIAALAAGGACDSPAGGATDAGADAATCASEECVPYACVPGWITCFHDCTTAAECAPGHVCEAGSCVGTECTDETAAEHCGPYACVNGTCAPDCALGPCADGFYCRGDTNQCVPKCTHRGDSSCDGYVCDVDSGECEPYCLEGKLSCAAGFACDDEDHCLPDESRPVCESGCGAYSCLGDRCATHCVEDDDCGVGATCVSERCVLD